MERGVAGGQYGGVSQCSLAEFSAAEHKPREVCPRGSTAPYLYLPHPLHRVPLNLYTHYRARSVFIHDIARCTQLIWVATVLSEGFRSVGWGWDGIHILGQMKRRVLAPGHAHTLSTHLALQRQVPVLEELGWSGGQETKPDGTLGKETSPCCPGSPPQGEAATLDHLWGPVLSPSP